MTSRGCAYSCSYCCHSYLHHLYKGKGEYLRQHKLEKVIEELVQAKDKYRIKYVRFFDDSLGTNIEWLREFSVQYKEKVGLPFICYMHPTHVSLESLICLKKAGCREIEMGVQSLTEKTRDNILNRNMPNELIEQAVDLIKAQKLSLITDNIVGLPDEGHGSVVSSAKFYNKRRVNRIYFFWLRFYPKIKLTEWAKKNGLISQVQYEEINNGEHSRPFSRGGDISNRVMVKLQILFLILPFLPTSLVDFMIDRKIYLYFPVILPPAILAALTSLFSNSLNDKIVHIKEIKHYAFGIKKFLLK
jgi:radical SAM superfamily enzyme YgiQ (UPF0313 family)